MLLYRIHSSQTTNHNMTQVYPYRILPKGVLSTRRIKLCLISRFSQLAKNRAEVGGAVTNYRATVEIYSSIFQGNQVTSNDIAQGFGGAISAVSNDTANFTTNYGQINRPSAQLTIQDTYIQGNYDGVTTVGQTGGGFILQEI